MRMGSGIAREQQYGRHLTRYRLIAAMACLLLTALPAFTIETAIPSDFMFMDVIDNAPDNEGYYYSASANSQLPGNAARPYAFVLDARGNVVWFRTDNEFHRYFPHRAQGRFILVRRDNFTLYKELESLSPGHEQEMVIPRQNPFRPTMGLDHHEAHIDEDGNIYTAWVDPQTVDMSEWVVGGNPQATVVHATVQQWNPDGDLLWEWRSFDHLDQLPYTLYGDTTELQDGHLFHIYMNSFQVLEDGDLMINSRKINMVYRVNYPDGNVEWMLGGPQSDFEFTNNLPDPGGPITFTWAHQPRLHADNRLTMLDNGNEHPVPTTYGKVYQLDFDAMTAELVWNYNRNDWFAEGGGSMQITEEGNYFVGWGAGGIGRNATEVTPDNEIVWDVKVFRGPDSVGTVSPTYRWYKLEAFTPSTRPYVSAVLHPGEQEIELVANWFGHEDEVDAYEIWWGEEEADHMVAVTTDGFHTITKLEVGPVYHARIRALSVNGNVVSSFSPTLEIVTDPTGVDELEERAVQPSVITLAPAYPNPFNSRTKLNLHLQKPADVSVQVVDILGQSVAQLLQGHISAGNHNLTFDASGLASGLYFIHVLVPGQVSTTQKVLLVQ